MENFQTPGTITDLGRIAKILTGLGLDVKHPHFSESLLWRKSVELLQAVLNYEQGAGIKKGPLIIRIMNIRSDDVHLSVTKPGLYKK
jgi:hypothetical protein